MEEFPRRIAENEPKKEAEEDFIKRIVQENIPPEISKEAKETLKKMKHLIEGSSFLCLSGKRELKKMKHLIEGSRKSDFEKEQKNLESLKVMEDIWKRHIERTAREFLNMPPDKIEDYKKDIETKTDKLMQGSVKGKGFTMKEKPDYGKLAEARAEGTIISLDKKLFDIVMKKRGIETK